MRVKVTLACTECKQRNYATKKNKKNDPDRIEMNKFCKFNHEFNKWMNEVCSRNVRNTIGRDIRQLLHDARCELVKALGLEVSLFPVEKYHCFNKAQCLLYSVQLDLNDLNDDGTLSNDGKARLDMLLDDVLIGDIACLEVAADTAAVAHTDIGFADDAIGIRHEITEGDLAGTDHTDFVFIGAKKV